MRQARGVLESEGCGVWGCSADAPQSHTLPLEESRWSAHRIKTPPLSAAVTVSHPGPEQPTIDWRTVTLGWREGGLVQGGAVYYYKWHKIQIILAPGDTHLRVILITFLCKRTYVKKRLRRCRMTEGYCFFLKTYYDCEIIILKVKKIVRSNISVLFQSV